MALAHASTRSDGDGLIFGHIFPVAISRGFLLFVCFVAFLGVHLDGVVLIRFSSLDNVLVSS